MLCSVDLMPRERHVELSEMQIPLPRSVSSAPSRHRDDKAQETRPAARLKPCPFKSGMATKPRRCGPERLHRRCGIGRLESPATFAQALAELLALLGRHPLPALGHVPPPGSATEARAESARMAEELKGLQSERKQVRGRIERLLEQIDELNAG